MSSFRASSTRSRVVSSGVKTAVTTRLTMFFLIGGLAHGIDTADPVVGSAANVDAATPMLVRRDGKRKT